MATVETLTRRFEKVFEPQQANVLAESIVEAYDDLIKTSDFSELKAIVRDLAQAQQRTETRVEELAQEMRALARVTKDIRSEIGGISRSMAYSLENDAYRLLPAFWEEQYDITIQERILRTDIQGEEVNFFALGQRNGEPICLVGESKMQLDERRRSRRQAERVIEQIENKVEAVSLAHPDRGIVRLLVTHYARPAIRHLLEENDIIVVETFDL